MQSNRFLTENPILTEYEVEPFFEDKYRAIPIKNRELIQISLLFSFPVPFISSSVQSKLAIRAVILNDPLLLKTLIDDVDRVYSVKANIPEIFLIAFPIGSHST